ncbi:Eco57I restriction-modification methylase domain-containing protein [Halodesulfovibrio sp. MK-HDV]|jgi:Eco57I restriction-modification methylase|uniref:Eco57I restriction-modification methylase domain-containing protein n=1 Tax=Halodesulfovibrio sp. MK-HDV TaxID=2599925 RepID=UPI00136D72E0|nr:N-6 DNA methylase [Halodesulfovibrio sp. MK-HDV]KAF1075924.1 hypothetical protein MKHDV_01722 [Halodesulfovibrio sp. MK-HDV]
MQPLDKTLRNQLERTIKNARDLAENAARAALEQLGVGAPTPFSHLDEQDRRLRRKLRVHGRQLGDAKDSKGSQETTRLLEEVAYEHWHRMLFARFLAENDLLMYPDPDEPVAITLEECEDLASEEDAATGWELAARYAAQMLPQIFRLESPIVQLTLPPEYQQRLEQLVAKLPQEVFTASDSLGWVYQFWQAKKKDQVNDSEVKIGARELPAVTQLFTEPYMVSFLLDNSLGAWWAAKQLSEADLKTANNEEELRQKAAIPGVPLEYLRFVQQNDSSWTPASDSFESWPNQLTELKTLDPCCGSGHFLVALFLMLVPIRMHVENLSAQRAADAVLKENLHGLELDQRCVELAAFALALAAWKYPNAGGYRPLPELNIACSGLSVGASKEQWTTLAAPQTKLRNALDLLYDEFEQAPILGSLLNPTRSIATNLVNIDELSQLLKKTLAFEQTDEHFETSVVAQGVTKATSLLTSRYHWVITNVPYLKKSKQCSALQSFCEQHYPTAKADLATVFLERCVELCTKGGTSSIVLPQSWLFLSSYTKFRKKILNNTCLHSIARLGPGAFETISGEVVKAILITLSSNTNETQHKELFQNTNNTNQLCGQDVSETPTISEKIFQLQHANITSVCQRDQLKKPDARIAFTTEDKFPLLNNYVNSLVGIQTGDDPRYLVSFWEIPWNNPLWAPLQSTPERYSEYGGQSWMIRWEDKAGELHKSKGARIQGTEAVGKNGIAIHRMGTIFPYHYSNRLYHQNIAVLLPKDEKFLPAIWCFCSSSQYANKIKQIDQSLKVTNATLGKVPFDINYWTQAAAQKYPAGLPKPFTSDPTQWVFHGHPCASTIWNENSKRTVNDTLRHDDTVLQVAIAKLLGFRWPAELDADMELAQEQHRCVALCQDLLTYADDDGIVCIPPVRGEASAADRLHNLLVAAYGDAWAKDTLATLLATVGHTGKSLETWLRDKFFTQHCKLFQHRPFIWHIWDGLQDGFAALVNYHKLNHKLLETLIYTYLGDWIIRQKQDISNGVDGAQDRLAAAESLKKKLELLLEGEAPYDIFIRWKSLEEQPVGWNPDINDGVRLNIRPFMTAEDVKKKGAGVLRDKPNIKWGKDRGKDRGKDVESAPWYHLFKGDRINDHHLSLAEKSAVRKANK